MPPWFRIVGSRGKADPGRNAGTDGNDAPAFRKHFHGRANVRNNAMDVDFPHPVKRDVVYVRAVDRFALDRHRRVIDQDVEPSDPAALASYVSTLVLGISVQAASGMKRKELLGIVENTLKVWPALIHGGKRAS